MKSTTQKTSRPVTSNQTGVHPKLARVVQKHLSAPYLRPCKTTSAASFVAIAETVARQARPLILDSGCGTGESTCFLAERFPEALVFGIDKSAVRLQKARQNLTLPENGILVRMDLIDFWRLAGQAGWQVARHFLLYPNPWPKKRQLRRRWHGHPVFPGLLALGGVLCLRSNWDVYVREFATAVHTATGLASTERLLQPEKPISAFEKKYQASGHKLYELQVDLSGLTAFGAPLATGDLLRSDR